MLLTCDADGCQCNLTSGEHQAQECAGSEDAARRHGGSQHSSGEMIKSQYHVARALYASAAATAVLH